MYLSDPTKYSEEERELLLKKVLEIFLLEDELVANIAWDMPMLLLPYFETSFDFAHGILSRSPLIKTLMGIFSILARKGNSKELFLASLEGFAELQVVPLDDEDERSPEVSERFFELKFVALHELLSYSLNNVRVMYPSRFLADATTTLTTFLAEQLDSGSLRSIVFILRRYFLFARDYNPLSSTSDEMIDKEHSLERKLLQRFVTDIVELSLQQYSLRWAQRFFVELRKGVAFVNVPVEEQPFQLDQLTLTFDDIIYRLMQLTYSLDVDVDAIFKNMLMENSNETTENELSDIAVFLVATAWRFENRIEYKVPLKGLIHITQRFILENESAIIPEGVFDSLIFWAIWGVRSFTSEEVQSVEFDLFASYLDLLTLIASSSPMETRQVAYSVLKRLLFLHTSETRFNWLISSIEFSPYLEIRDISIRMLKDSILPPKASKDPDNVLANVTESISHMTISDTNHTVSEKMLEKIEVLAKRQVAGVESIDDHQFVILLSWINFMIVVKTRVVKDIVERAKELIKKETPAAEDLGLQNRITMLEIALSSLELQLIDQQSKD